MTEAEVAADDIDEDVLEQNLVQHSVELYSLLCQLLEGEALTILRSVGAPHGLRAWQLLYRKYNPRTMAKSIRMLCEVASPPKVTHLKDFEGHLMNWRRSPRSCVACSAKSYPTG